MTGFIEDEGVFSGMYFENACFGINGDKVIVPYSTWPGMKLLPFERQMLYETALCYVLPRQSAEAPGL